MISRKSLNSQGFSLPSGGQALVSPPRFNFQNTGGQSEPRGSPVLPSGQLPEGKAKPNQPNLNPVKT